MKRLIIVLVAFCALSATAQPVIRNAPGEPPLGLLDSLTTLKPHITCPNDTGHVWWWQMATGPMGVPPYWHSMTFFTDGDYHLGVDDSHILQPGFAYCFLCTEGTNYNAIDFDNLPDSFGVFSPPPSCDLVPSYTIAGDIFTYDESYAEALGEKWSIKRSEDSLGGSPYSYKTPRHSPYTFNTLPERDWWFVSFRLPSGQLCTDTLHVAPSSARRRIVLRPGETLRDGVRKLMLQ